MKIVWSDPAILDLENIKNYIAKDSPYYASIFVEKIIEAIDKLSSFPSIGRIVPEFNNKNIREVIYQHYRVIYQTTQETIFILTVIHGGRDLTNWLQDN
ncbi:MAG: type II toxin-antitoxin system RelE/ParE family toxin [Candidatus Omnitrophica bacterium]|nr:type II toxin-antitoxin system RelE/ParE family toxin [Candidatus Omnitrophota bacterium]MBU1133799.1 type II toxin-antitoxin system RelE/ParE family toxin [Candidatus Omnitrophota bacterium]MBU2505037.1 type II toxin-antitoxin system RelE/ParE family toxin [Candidatus Omnitrophota bacterium]